MCFTVSVGPPINLEVKLITFVNYYLPFLTHHSRGLKKEEMVFPRGYSLRHDVCEVHHSAVIKKAHQNAQDGNHSMHIKFPPPL